MNVSQCYMPINIQPLPLRLKVIKDLERPFTG